MPVNVCLHVQTLITKSGFRACYQQQALFRFYKGSIQALFRLYSGCVISVCVHTHTDMLVRETSNLTRQQYYIYVCSEDSLEESNCDPEI